MAEYTLSADQHAIHEIALSPGVSTSIAVVTNTTTSTAPVQILHLSGDKPVYVRGGMTVSVRDDKADIVVPGTWLDFGDANIYRSGSTFALVSESAAVVSVVRS